MKAKRWFFGLLSATMLGALLATGPAMAQDFPNFTINENSVPGTSPFGNPALVADRLNGLFTETFTPAFIVPGIGPLHLGGSGTFTSIANFNISAYYENNVIVPGALGCGFAACYNMYGTMNATGTFSIDLLGNVTFTGTGGSVGLFVDPDQTQGNGDDYLVASSVTLLTGDGHFNLGLASGDFEIIWTFVMLGDPSFFTSPDPFYTTVDVNGNFTQNPILAGGAEVSGSANAFFSGLPAPEPGTLVLFGIGLFGLGFVMRRRGSA